MTDDQQHADATRDDPPDGQSREVGRKDVPLFDAVLSEIEAIREKYHVEITDAQGYPGFHLRWDSGGAWWRAEVVGHDIGRHEPKPYHYFLDTSERTQAAIARLKRAELMDQLHRLRRDIMESGTPLLTWEEIERELKEGRNGGDSTG